MSLVESFSKSSPNRQVAIVATAGAVLCGVLILIYFVWVRTPYQILFTNLRSVDAATIVASLDEKKIPYRVKGGGETILVPADQVEAVRLELMTSELPLKGVVGFELFNKSDMGLTEFAQKINYQRALQGELARTIMALGAVDTARVHLSLAEPTIFREDRRPPKASVTVFARPGQTVSAQSVVGIQRLIAAAVPELESDAVVVLDDRGQVLSGEPVRVLDATTREREAIEGYYVSEIQGRLNELASHLNAQVSVSALTPRLDQLKVWTPESRDFGLSVEVSVSPPASPDEDTAIRRGVFEAIDANPGLDRVVIRGAAASRVQGQGAARSSVTHDVEAVDRNATTWPFYIAGLAALGAVVVAFVMGRRRPNKPRMTAEQRDAYARRLGALLDGEDNDAAAAV